MSDQNYRPHDTQWRALQKYRMKRFAGPKAMLPTGLQIDGTSYAGVRPPGADATFVLHSPEKILKDPRSGYKYCWRLRSDEETIGLVEAQELRPVRMDEIDRTKQSAKVIGFVGPRGIEYAGWKRFALFEVPPKLAYEWFQQPADYGMARTLNLSDSFAADVEKQSHGKMEGRIEIRERRSAADEPA